MISDDTLQSLLAFRRDRDWEQFHSSKNLAVSISLEAAELLEHFQWTSDTDVAGVAAGRREKIGNEIADIAIYLTYLSHDLGLDLDKCVRAKLAINEQKYPVDKFRGVSRKYDQAT